MLIGAYFLIGTVVAFFLAYFSEATSDDAWVAAAVIVAWPFIAAAWIFWAAGALVIEFAIAAGYVMRNDR